MMHGLAAEAAVPKTVMIPFRGFKANRCRATDAIYIKSLKNNGNLDNAMACTKIYHDRHFPEILNFERNCGV